MDLSIFFAGTAGSVPTARRGLPAVLVRRGGDRLLIDCGEGTQRQLLRSVGLADVHDVFLTHLHVDHWLGVLGMVKTFALRDREIPLELHGPPGTVELMDAMRRVIGRLPYPFHVSDLEGGDVVERDGYEIGAFAVRHRGGPALGYALSEPPRPGRFDDARAQALGVPFGPDFGRLQRGETVNGVSPGDVIGPERRGRRIVLSGDTAPCEAVRMAAVQADVLVHEATFTDEELDRAMETGHSTARQAAEIAVECDVGLLALTHVSTRYTGREIRDEARGVFARTELPRDFDTIEVPYAERGEPQLVRWPRSEPRSAGAEPAPSA